MTRLTVETVRDLAAFAGDLAGEFALEPLLERILRNAVRLLRCESGSICTIDERASRYRKEVDLDVGCRSGETFPLDEGVTGAVVRAGGPVTFARYSLVPGGHIGVGDSRRSRAVIGVPIRQGDALTGAFVVFAGDETRVFGDADIELLELFAIHASVAIANSRWHGARAAITPAVRPTASPRHPLTPREAQTRALVERGWQDKQIAAELGISVKTVEKHVGTVLRKTGARNRTELASFAATRAG
ncbi:GAF domain-containing protein [Marisediminicola senii]|uniref:GAF domain-containing protein n=1 Tax=Marisediminicola senii TaxID=2711233 RepID=UPI0013E9D5C7|nr:GAF domain-containing protein [Marisediminicola senii]